MNRGPCAIVGLCLVLFGCGGGAADDEDFHDNRGFVTITHPTGTTAFGELTFTTQADSILLAGTTFTSRNARCCSDPDPAVTVTWSNDRGGSGTDSAGATTCSFFGLVESFCGPALWLFNDVPLSLGTNV